MGTVTVHPHARGEHRPTLMRRSALGGSSPRTWGTLSVVVVFHLRFRFIPTHVGNTREKKTPITQSTVHPHARGEHRTMNPRPEVYRGSSPRTWGTLALVRGHLVLVRFIPTHVGNTLRAPWSILPITVHPHARGEHARQSRVAESKPRFIPTHVGNTQRHRTEQHLASVHPHARGEHRDRGWGMNRDDGSSPRTWGTPLLR